jgi:phosphotransferase system enzyme I (PtsI)
MGHEPEYMVTLKGIPGSPGIVFGKAHLVDRKIVKVPRETVPEAEVAAEVRRFRKAVEDAKQQLRETKARLDRSDGKEHLFILDTHLMIMEDEVVLQDVAGTIEKDRINAEWALKNVFDRFKRTFDGFDDEILRDRKSDLDHICRRILQNLMGVRQDGLFQIDEEVVLIAHDLSPYDMAHIDREKVFGLATDIGGNTSHLAILARAIGIPAVVGLEEATSEVKSGDLVILDGIAGTMIINPTEPVIEDYQKRKRRFEKIERELHTLVPLPARTKDGFPITLSANIELPEEIPTMLAHGVRSIGLVRSEYLYLTAHQLATEEQHLAFYKEILQRVAPNPVTIRTLDVGGDKFLAQFGIPREANPALGLRAIRFCLAKRQVFRLQLRALAQAGVHGNLRIMFPMISGLEEVQQAKEVFEDVLTELEREGTPVRRDVKLGIMIEVPSAAAIADVLAKEVDFFSIGTNDLIQYALAIDRVNEHVSYLFRPLHPAVLRTVRDVVRAGHDAGIEVGICGEMAGEPLYLPLLLGLGLDELSMNTISVLKVKRVLLATTMDDARALARDALALRTAGDVERFVVGEMKRRFPEDFQDYDLPRNGRFVS